MLQIHPNARTTPVTRAEIAGSHERSGVLAQRYGVSAETIRKWTGQKLDITNWEDEISFMTWTLKALQGLSAVLIVILIAIIIIGIMNTMWIAIRERTREIGTLRAIGMQRGEVLWMFLLESLMLGLLATVAGDSRGG